MKIFAWLALASSAYSAQYDVAVLGATPAGIAAALGAARAGRTVLLTDDGGRIGGHITAGLSYTDFRTLESVTGIFREYMSRVETHYRQKYGAASQQVKDCFYGAHAEPHVSLAVFEAMVREQPRITLQWNQRLLSVRTAGGNILAARFTSMEAQARVWIDATYEGDLAAMAGVPYRVGRESTKEYGERLAGLIYFDNGRFLPGSTGEADSRVQTYNYRILMTDRKENRVAVEKPAGYQREEFLHLLPHFRSGRLRKVFTENKEGILRVQRLPNGKADINDIKQAPIRLSLPGENNEYPEGSAEVRARIVERHKQYNMGLLYFLQNDVEVPDGIREECRQWGLAKDEFTDTGHWPNRMYVREARRIVGAYVFREQDVLMVAGSVRAPLHRDSIAIGDYALNCHGEQGPGPLHPQITEGDFAYGGQPFQVPYGVMVPRKIANLLVPVALSATHVGYSALRLEPTFTAIGHAAGIAAHHALAEQVSVAEVPVPRVQRDLHAAGSSTVYVSDVPPGSPHYRAVQWLGTQGLLHSLYDPAKVIYEPLRPRYGLQYSHAFAHHDVQPEQPMDARVAALWNAPPGWQSMTRGAVLKALFTR